MILLLYVMQRVSLYYYTIFTYYYVIVTPGCIIQSGGWWNTPSAVLNFGVLKRIQTPHSLLNFFWGFRSR